VTRDVEARQEAEAERAGEIDGERAERELGSVQRLDAAVELEAGDRAGPAEERRADPGQRAQRSLARRTSAVVR
jgi:hypothetical protein